MHHEPKNGSKSKPQAFECTLYFCVKDYTAVMANGKFSEQVSATWPGPNETLPNMPDIVDRGSGELRDRPEELKNTTTVVLEPPGKGEIYRVDSFSYFLFRAWLIKMMDFLVSGYGGGTDGDFRLQDLSSAMNILLTKYAAAPGGAASKAMDAFADAFTSVVRRKSDQGTFVEGRALREETFVKARWGWAILPVGLVLLTCFFMTCTLVITIRHEVPIWKSSALAALAHGLSEHSRSDVTADKLDEIESKAENLRMTMKGGGKGRTKADRWRFEAFET